MFFISFFKPSPNRVARCDLISSSASGSCALTQRHLPEKACVADTIITYKGARWYPSKSERVALHGYQNTHALLPDCNALWQEKGREHIYDLSKHKGKIHCLMLLLHLDYCNLPDLTSGEYLIFRF